MTEKKEEKGRITADVSEEAVREALRSVERIRGEAEQASQEETGERAAGAGAGETAPRREATAPEAAPANEAEAALRKDLEVAQAALEESQRRSREMMERLKDTHDRMLRAVADLENFKKRAAKEKEDAQKYGVERLVKELLPVMDNLERALEAARQSRDVDALVSGVQLTLKLAEAALGKFGVQGHPAAGKPFDPSLMEAMMQEERSDLPPNTVISEYAKGYTLHGRLIRPAAVVVSRAPATQESPPREEEAQPPPGGEQA